MREHPLRRILSRIVHGSADASEVQLAYVHRGAPEDRIEIKVSSITRLGKGWFMLGDGETQIPFHRVLYVKNGAGTILWEKRRPPRISTQDP